MNVTAVAEPDEKILIPVQNIAWAMLVVRSAHRLLNAVLDDKPKATIVRELAVELEEFMVTSTGLGDLDLNADRFDEIHEMLTAPQHYSVRLADGNLVVESRTDPDPA